MKTYILSLFLLILFNFTYAQEEVMIGITDKQDFLKSEHHSWYTENYKTFDPNSESINKLNQLLNNSDFKIEVYFGSWCSDSQRELPRLIKLLENTKFDFKNLKLVGVGRDKVVPNATQETQERLNITNVPTIIVYQNAKEINRFVEYAQESLAKDLIKILSKQGYKHSYQF